MRYILPIIFLLLHLFSFSQSADSLMAIARNKAYSGKTEAARATCQQILKTYPSYSSAQVLWGRTLAWDKLYDSAEVVLKQVLEYDYKQGEAASALADLYKWTNRDTLGLICANRGLSFFPNNEELLFKKAYFLYKLNYTTQAIVILEKLLEQDPKNFSYQQLYRQLTVKKKFDYAGIFHAFESFHKPYDKQISIVTLEYSRKTSFGTFIPRINNAYWHGVDNLLSLNPQFEIDMYPNLTDKYQIYANFGYAPKDHFPLFRMGFEIHRTIGRGFEAGLGMRELLFEDGNGVFILTAALEKYAGNYWFMARPYISPVTSNIFSQSVQLSIRRYYGIRTNYMELTLVGGSEPDDTFLNFDYLMPNDIRYKSAKAFTRIKHQVKEFGLIKLGVGIEHAEYRQGEWKDIVSTFAGFALLLD